MKWALGKIATVQGRYYAMDRDKRWDRVENILPCDGIWRRTKYTDPVAALSESYEKSVFDEFVMPTVIVKQMNSQWHWLSPKIL